MALRPVPASARVRSRLSVGLPRAPRAVSTAPTSPSGQLPGVLPAQAGCSAQLTEPALLLIALGIGLAILHLLRRQPFAETLLVMLAWFFIPAAYVVTRQPSIYNNFRQLLFILPPAFVLAGLAIDWIFRRVSAARSLGLA